MIKFEDIQKANESIKTTDIKGKEYAEVNQRVKAFRMVYPTGSIKTQMVSNENGVCIFKAEVYGGIVNIGENLDGETVYDMQLLGTGHAYEKENSSFINETSYIENCETSAVGRALGMAGFGIDTSVASAEEVENAIIQQDSLKQISKTDLNVLQAMIKDLPEPKAFYDGLLKHFEITDLTQLTCKQHVEILKKIREIKGE